MKQFWLAIGLLVMLGCAPKEAAFKSDVPVTLIVQKTQEIPPAVNLSAPFYPQAPDADWSLPWQEACEEASVILTYHGITGKPITRDRFREEILNIVDWEKERFGYYEHTTVDQTAEILRDYYKYSDFEIVENPSVDDLKGHLAQGHLIIAPFAGRQLGNPFYRGSGPYYHMLVIKGYDDDQFITDDVGTRRGENFVYPYKRLMNALHDWHETDMNLGEKKVIVVQ